MVLTFCRYNGSHEICSSIAVNFFEIAIILNEDGNAWTLYI